MNDVCTQFVSVANLDGVQISQRVLDGLNNANLKQTVQRVIKSQADRGLLENKDKCDWYLNKRKDNVSGIGLNHDFPTKGQAQLNDNRGKASSEFYEGPSAASGPETQATTKPVDEQKFSRIISCHVQGQIIYWSQVHAFKEVQAKDKAMAVIAACCAGYALVDPAADGSRYGAGFKDWLDWEKGTPNTIPEVRLGVLSVPENQIERVWQQSQGLFPELVNALFGCSGESISNNTSAAATGGTAQDDDVRYVSPKNSGDTNESPTPPGVE